MARPRRRGLQLEALEDRLNFSAGLVAAYNFDQGSGSALTDVSGNGHTGTIVNAAWSTAGKYGDALSFNGTSALVNIPDATSLHLTTGMTLEAWVEPTAAGNSWQDVLYKGNDNYYLEASSNPVNTPAAGATVGSADFAAYGTTPLSASTWSFLTESYDGTTLRLYVNGAQVASQAQSGSLATSTDQLQIGGDSLFGQYFKGLIDNVRIYNVALTAAEIQDDMNTPAAAGTPPPTAPANLTAAASGSTITLNWTTSQDTIGVSSYVVERENPGSTSFVQIGTATGTTYSDTGLTANSTYNYEVQAVDWAGNQSAVSKVASATTSAPDTTPPSTPTNLAAVAAGTGQIKLSWTPSTDNVGVTGYDVWRENPGSTSFVQIGTATGTTYSDSGLAPQSTYTYEVQATDAAGNLSGFSSTASATTTAGNPGLVAAYNFDQGGGSALTDVSGNGRTGTIVNAAWSTAGKYGDALSFNGTSALVSIPDATSLHLTTGMTLEAWVEPTAAESNWQDVIYKGNDNYYLEASSSPGNTPAAGATVGSADFAAYGTTPLSANTWSFLTETYDGTTMRLYVNGVQVASQAQSGSLATSTDQLQIGGDSLFGQYFKGLIDNVRIYNVALTAAEIQDDMNTPVAAGTPPPTAPANLTATASGSTITLNWTTSQDTVGVSSYVVERENPGSTSFVQIGTATGTTYSDAGLTANSTYIYEVQAVDWAGNQSAVSNTASATTSAPDTTPPSTPTNLAAVAAGTGQIKLSWTPSTDNVGVTGYDVWRENPGSTSFVQIGTTTATTYSDTGLAPLSTYTYEVQATDAAGNLSGFSSAASATTTAGNPGLVAAYNFDQGSGSALTDVSGNAHTGTIVNAAWSTAGKYGDALSFNGTSALVNIPDATSLHLTTGMTLEAWVEPTAAGSGWQDVIYKGNDNYYLEASSSPGNTPAAGATVGSADFAASGMAPLSANTWSFLTETYDGTTVRLYVNGVQVASHAQSGSLATSTDQLQIGGDSLFGQHFKGLIDNVRIYNVALTAAEIQDDRNTPVAADTPPPTAPANLTATAGGSMITLNWTPSQDTIGVSSYVVEREDPGSTSFVQIGTATGTTYSDTGLTDNSTYNYEVQAVDWAGNQSAVSNVASATAQFGISPTTTSLQPGQTQQFTANATGVIWSVNGVAGGAASTGTITSTGLYTAPNSVGSYTVTGATADGMHSASASVNVTNYSGTLTDRNDNLRTGANLDETILTPTGVNSSTFGKLFSYPLDGIAFASPLYVPHLAIPGMGFHNVVFVATEHDSVYAFDADGLSTTPLWHVSFINPAAGITPIPAADTLEPVDIPNEVGITGTPVIDPTTGTLYLVADTKVVASGTTTYFQTLHALDIITGAEKDGGPVVIQATVPGTGSDSVNGIVTFNPLFQNQHSGLLLSNGIVYIAFSSHGDDYPNWHGWLFGYNASTLKQVMVYNDTTNGDGGGIWMGADGLATDSTGDIYFTTGNGNFDANTGGVDYGNSAEKLSPSGTVLDYFTPFDQATLNNDDLDLASGGVLLLPTQSGPNPDEMVFAGKGGTVYVVNRDNMGHYNSSNNSQIIQSLPNIFPAGNPLGNFSSPVYYSGNVYFAPVNGKVQAFSLSNGLLSTAPTSASTESYAYPGGMMAISANGATNGILWAVQDTGTTTPGVLHAYLATNLSDELYNSSQSGSRDTMDPAAKFSMPTVANGKVYIGGCTQLTVYGLLAPDPPSDPPTSGGTMTASQLQSADAPLSAGPVTLTATKDPALTGTVATFTDSSPVDPAGKSTTTLPPVASPDTFVLSQNGPNSGSGTMSVLANDSSADGQRQNLVATLVSNATHGSLTLNSDGSFTYTPNSTFQGIDRFSYQVSEGGETGNTVTDTLLSYNASLIDKLYQQVLHRPAEDAGLVAWTSMLDRGAPLDVVLKEIFDSPERLDPLVMQFYEEYLGRAADSGGLAAWVADWQKTGGPQDVVVNILASQEFYNDAADSNAGFVTRLYEKFLNRMPDATGLNFWIGLMAPPTNQSRAEVATEFYNTPEEHGLLVDFLFSEYFKNSNPLPDKASYVTDLNQGASETAVELKIIDSPEYRDNPPAPAAGTIGKALYER